MQRFSAIESADLIAKKKAGEKREDCHPVSFFSL